MKQPTLPSADHLTKALETAHCPVDIYSVHGMLNGMYCGGLPFDSPSWEQQIFDLISGTAEAVGLEILGEDGLKALEQMRAQVISVYDNRLAVPILLPPFSKDLAAKAGALGAWCDGWITGFGAVFNNANTFAPELEETVREITEIAQLDAKIENQDEEAELSLQALIDHVSQAVEYVYDTVCGGPQEHTLN